MNVIAARPRSVLHQSRSVIFVIGWLLGVLGVLMIVPAAADLSLANPDWRIFASSSAVTLFVGTTLVLSNWGADMRLSFRQGVILTVASWLSVVAFSSLPLMLSTMDMGYTDAFFEAMSGLTTTGSTVISGLDVAPPGILLWRGLLQWLGGIGVIVLGIVMLPFLRFGGMQLFRLESSDRSDRPIPRFRRFVVAILLIYVSLTALCCGLLMLAGMGAFDAVVHAMTTLSTGGYSTADASIAKFANPTAEWIITLFMALGSLPFVLYISALQGHPRRLLRDSQILSFLTFIAIVIAGITFWLWRIDGIEPVLSLRLAAFNVVSIVTTTGYSTADYTQWGTLPLGVFFLITLVGGCTGSTAGGIKIFRFQLFALMLKSQLYVLVHPHAVRSVNYGDRRLSPDVLSGGILYVCLFLTTVGLTAMVLEALGIDLVTALSAAATSVANVGPGLGNIIGPAGNFAALPDSAKWVLSLAMLLGRLEVFAVLVMFSPAFWRI